MIADAAGNCVPFGTNHAERLVREIGIGMKRCIVRVRVHGTMSGLCQWLVGDGICCRDGAHSVGGKDKRAFSLRPAAHSVVDTPVGNGTNHEDDEFTPDDPDGKAEAPSNALNFSTPGYHCGVDLPAESISGLGAGGFSSGSPPAELPRLELPGASVTEEPGIEDPWGLTAAFDLTVALNHAKSRVSWRAPSFRRARGLSVMALLAKSM
jgi:hypothetical protein